MMAFLRTLPNTLWWITAFLSALAFFTQIGIAVARSGAVSVGRLLTEFVVTVVLLAIPTWHRLVRPATGFALAHRRWPLAPSRHGQNLLFLG